MLLLAVACGSPAATSEPAPPAAVSAPEATAPAAAVRQQAVATATPVRPAESSSPGQQTAEPAVATVLDRPTLKAGVIWLESPLDPVEGGYVSTQSAMSETLFRLSGTTLSPEPWLATEATQVAPSIWRIGIREGVKFHNGNVMDAQAVKASLERAIRLSPAAADTLSVDTITVEDGQTITIKTTVQQPTLPGLLILPALAITDAAAADTAGEGNFIAAGALTGPYIPTEYTPKERLNSVANDDYWGGTPPLAGIEHVAIPDTNSRELALQAGDIDVAVNVSPDGAQAINAHQGTHTETSGIGTSLVLWWVNFERGTLADPLVRRAVAHAIDRESIASLVAPPGSGSFAELLLPEALVACPGVNAPGYDPDVARNLLAQAGYTDSDGDGILDKEGQPLEIIIGGYPERFQLPIMAEVAQAMLADVGIKVEVLITEWSVVKEPAWDLFGWYNTVVQGGGDPVFNISQFAGLKGDASGSGTNNYGHYDASRLVDIITPSTSVADLEGRKEIACEALAVVTEEAAFLPVAHVNMVYGVSDRVTDFEAHPTSHYFFSHRIGLTE
jgi:peptide/nickel transport system substrate-binding protein